MDPPRQENAAQAESRPTFARPGYVSLWLSTVSLAEVPEGYLEGAPEVLAWLFVEFGVAVDGAFSTNYTADHEPGRLRELIDPLHASEGFVEEAVSAAASRDLERASFVLGLYDLDYLPRVAGLDEPCGTPALTFLGSFRYEGGG
jgi:hypothetical protein